MDNENKQSTRTRRPAGPPVASSAPVARSRLGNGRLPRGIDGRSAQARRQREVLADIETAAAEVGPITPTRRLLINRAVACTLAAEDLEVKMVKGEEVSPETLALQD